jgi:hypothetical protein
MLEIPVGLAYPLAWLPCRVPREATGKPAGAFSGEGLGRGPQGGTTHRAASGRRAFLMGLAGARPGGPPPC